jgi:hypothetical protein
MSSRDLLQRVVYATNRSVNANGLYIYMSIHGYCDRAESYYGIRMYEFGSTLGWSAKCVPFLGTWMHDTHWITMLTPLNRCKYASPACLPHIGAFISDCVSARAAQLFSCQMAKAFWRNTNASPSINYKN